MKIILQRRYAFLFKDIEKAFRENDNVRIWMDRRYEDRRSDNQPVLFERRLGQRRLNREFLAQVVINDQ